MEFVEAVYEDLRSLAAAFMLSERPSHTLQPTAVVHEAFLRLMRQERARYNGPVHFRAVAAIEIRRLLVEHARKVGAAKRGGGWQRTEVEPPAAEHLESGALLDLDAALDALAVAQPRVARIVELRFFGGLSIDETAATLEISPRSVDRDWTLARAWLRRRLATDEPDA